MKWNQEIKLKNGIKKWNELKKWNEIIKWIEKMKWIEKEFFRIFSGLMDWARIEQKKSYTDILLKLGALSS